MTKKMKIGFVLVSIVTGYLSGLLYDHNSYFFSVLHVGLVYGLGISLVYLIFTKKWVGGLLFVLCSTASYYLALRSGDLINFTDTDEVYTLVAGLVGAGLLAVSSKFLFRDISIKSIFLECIVGGFFGYIFLHLLLGTGDNVDTSLSFIAWQVGVTFTWVIMQKRTELRML